MSENPVKHFKARCSVCKQEVEFLSVFPEDVVCATCQYLKKPEKKKERKPDQFGWTLHPDCKAILDQQSAAWVAGAKSKLSLKMIRRQKKARAMKGG